jgi:GT2 family glycosyltransferase
MNSAFIVHRSGFSVHRAAVVIVTWNSAQFIRDCLSSIPAADHPETVVVDNASTDDTVKIIRDEFPAVRLILNSTNDGYARANNQALAEIVHRSTFIVHRSADYILLLNPDTRLPADAIEKLITFMDSRSDAGVLAPKLVNPDGTPQPSVRRFPTYRNMLATLFGNAAHYKMQGFDFNRTQEVEQPMASCLLIRAEALRQVGTFDERFPMFMNDVDLLKRIAGAGWKIVYCPEVAVWHYRGGSTTQARRAMILSMHQSLFRYFRKHDRSGWFWLRAIPLALVIELAALVRILVLSS